MNQAAEQKPGYLTTKQVADRWCGRIKVRTLNNWRITGSGPPYVKLGGAVLYPLEKLVAWEEANTVTSTSEYGRKPKDEK